MRTTLKFISLFLAGLLLVGCEQDGPAEKFGEAVDDAAEELSDSGESVADAVEDSGDRMANAVEDACEKAKEGVNAKDTDC